MSMPKIHKPDDKCELSYIYEYDIRGFLSDKDWLAFTKFMGGQTVSVDKDGNHLIYAYDWNRWFSQGKQKHQLSSDWD